MAKTRVLIVDDSATVRGRLRDVLGADPDVELVGEAADGKVAIDLCRKLRPDIVTLDMMMPVMTGVATTEYIMAHMPTPILIVSSSTNRGEVFKTYDALAAGAVDVMEKPRGDEPVGEWERQFISTVKLVARIRVITHPRARLRDITPNDPLLATPPTSLRPELVAIGASTGGPAAIVEILRGLPQGFPLPVLFVLHINEPFGSSFSDWLDAQTLHRVSFARDGESLAGVAGRIVMAPPDRHLVVEHGRLRLTRDGERHSCRPSIDVLFESLARDRAQGVVACLLTGMGRDGASGMLAIRNAGGLTIAQDEASSVVFGMPREAALLGAAARVLPLAQIGPALAALTRTEKTR
jgi:two-component system, chemotaxis family, protein-glutamate methylesterase/glutaminase